MGSFSAKNRLQTANHQLSGNEERESILSYSIIGAFERAL